jgi:conjugal transfer pilin signal peptidase TrbI
MTTMTWGEKTSTMSLRFAHWLGKWWWFPVTFLVVLLVCSRYLTLGLNVTESLPYSVFLVLKQSKDVGRGDYAAFRWVGAVPYPSGVVFIKRVAGVEGDRVSAAERRFAVNGLEMGRAKEAGTVGNMAGKPLELGPQGVIPAGHYFMQGDHKDSLDSRYGLLGWVPQERIIGRAIPLF